MSEKNIALLYQAKGDAQHIPEGSIGVGSGVFTAN